MPQNRLNFKNWKNDCHHQVCRRKKDAYAKFQRLIAILKGTAAD